MNAHRIRLTRAAHLVRMSRAWAENMRLAKAIAAALWTPPNATLADIERSMQLFNRIVPTEGVP